MIARMTEGAPKVAVYGGEIAITAIDDGVPHGFHLAPPIALTVAMRLLASVASLPRGDAFVFPCDGVELSQGHDDGTDRTALLRLSVEGAPFTVALTETQVAELAVTFVAASQLLDQRQLPHRDG